MLDSRLDNKLERARLRRLFERGLDKVVGCALPLGWGHRGRALDQFAMDLPARAHVPLPGDSPMGFSLRWLDALVWEKPELRQPVARDRSVCPRSVLPGGTRVTEPGVVSERSYDLAP